MEKEVIESFIESKTGNLADCEDEIVISENFFAVIDGVTSKFPIKYNGLSSGRFCASVVSAAILSLEKSMDAVSALQFINDAIKKAYGGAEITNENKMQACAIIYSKQRREIWCYGDCQLMINGVCFDHTKEIDKLLSSLRAFVIEAYLCEGNEKDALFEKDIGREAILPFLKKQATFANKEHPFGYAVLDGTGINKSLIKTYELKIGDSVVLASDGYPKLCKTLKDSEECLKNALLSDPLSIKENRQTKMKSKKNASFDDRAYLSFTVE